MAKYDFNFTEEAKKAIAKGLNQEVNLLEQLQNLSPNQEHSLLSVEICFLIWMKQWNCPVSVSGIYWMHLGDYLAEGKGKWISRLQIEDNKLNEWLNAVSGLFLDGSANVASILWLTPYLLTFLYENQLINTFEYKKQNALIQRYKREFKKDYRLTLWKYNFVHDWNVISDDMVEAHKEEITLFNDSFLIEPSPSIQRDIFKFDESFKPKSIEEESIGDIKFEPEKPIKLDRKIGRNEKVSVEYPDGTIKKDIKFKKVMEDVLAGKCELI